MPEPYNTLYDPDDGPDFQRAESPRQETAAHPFLDYVIGRQKRGKFLPGMKGKVSSFSDEDFRAIRALYYGMISETDAQLGRIWQAIRKAGAWDDTIIILTSDHAEMMGDHFMLGKGGFFDQSFHIPLIVRDPRLRKTAGSVVDKFTEAVDVMPTLLELLDTEIPAHLDGRSLAPFLRGKQPSDWRDAAHWEFDFRSIEKGSAERHFGLKPQQCNLSVIRGEKWKYVHFGGGLPPLLFDLESIPANCTISPTIRPFCPSGWSMPSGCSGGEPNISISPLRCRH